MIKLKNILKIMGIKKIQQLKKTDCLLKVDEWTYNATLPRVHSTYWKTVPIKKVLENIANRTKTSAPPQQTFIHLHLTLDFKNPLFKNQNIYNKEQLWHQNLDGLKSASISNRSINIRHCNRNNNRKDFSFQHLKQLSSLISHHLVVPHCFIYVSYLSTCRISSVFNEFWLYRYLQLTLCISYLCVYSCVLSRYMCMISFHINIFPMYILSQYMSPWTFLCTFL